MREMTKRQVARQRARAHSGQYTAQPCYSCGRGCPSESYGSHHMTDATDVRGARWGDLALVLCGPCGRASGRFDLKAQMVAFMAVRGAGGSLKAAQAAAEAVR